MAVSQSWQGEPGGPDIPPEFLERIEKLTPRLLAWVRLRVGQDARVDADDVVQEIWCRVLRKFGDFDPAGEAPFEAWVFRIGKFVMLEAWRRARSQGRVESPGGRTSMFRAIDALPSPISTMTRKVAQRSDVQSFLSDAEQLSDEDRKLLALCGLEQLSHAEVGIQLGLSTEAVHKRWQRLRERLKDHPMLSDC